MIGGVPGFDHGGVPGFDHIITERMRESYAVSRSGSASIVGSLILPDTLSSAMRVL